MKKIFLSILVIPLLFVGCKKYKRDNQWDTKYELDRNVSISISPTIVYESQTTDGKVADNENVYFKINITNSGPDVAYFTEFRVDVPGSFLYDTYPDQGAHYSTGDFSGGNEYGLKGFIAPSGTTTLNWGTISSQVYSIKLYSFSAAPNNASQVMTFTLIDANGKEYSTSIPFQTL